MDWDDVKLSGVGAYAEHFTAPRNPKLRYDSRGVTASSLIDIHLHPMGRQYFADPDPFAESFYWGFGFHASCWNILANTFPIRPEDALHACLSMSYGELRVLNWGHDYGGFVPSYNERETRSPFTHYFASQSKNPIRFDPSDISAIQCRAQSPPAADSSIPVNPGRNQIPFSKSEVLGDCFRRLPPELLQEILKLLPSRDVCSSRLASRIILNTALVESFWASRFYEGHEYHCMFEFQQSKPNSWRTIYRRVSAMQSNPSMINRKRIWGLALQLRNIFEQMGVKCHGVSLKSFFEPSADIDSHTWCHSNCLDESFRDEQSAIRYRMLALPLSYHIILASFVQIGNNRFISGFRIRQRNGDEVCLGYIHRDQESPLYITAHSFIRGWHIAHHELGLKAVAAVMENGSVSPWVGEHDGVLKKRLATRLTSISYLHAKFDALKLISLGIPAPKSKRPTDPHYGDNRLWSSDIPPPHIFLSENEDELTARISEGEILPYSAVIFGGNHGQDLDKLIEVVGWVCNPRYIVAIEFRYTGSLGNRVLGAIGPLELNGRELYPTPFPFHIDGPGGERVSSIQVRMRYSRKFLSLKIKTNHAREVIFPPKTNGIWKPIAPIKDTVVGFHSIMDKSVKHIGLLSIDMNH